MQLQSILPHAITGAVGATVLRFVLNQIWTVNGVGMVDRGFPYPLSEWWMWAIGGMVLATIRQWRSHHARLDIEAWAHQAGHSFHPTIERGDLGDLSRFGLFEHWSSAANRVSSNIGDLECELFDYTSIHHGDDSDSYRSQTVVLIPELDFALPVFELRPTGYYTGLLRTMTGITGLQLAAGKNATRADIDAVSQFNKCYSLFPCRYNQHLAKAVRGEQADTTINTEPLRDLFSADLLRFFAERRGWCVESTGSGLALWKPARIAGAGERQAMLDGGQEILDALREAAETPASSDIDFQADSVDSQTIRWGFYRFTLCVFGGFILGGAVGMTLFFRSSMVDDGQLGLGRWHLAMFFLPIFTGLAIGGFLAWWLARRR